MVCWSRRNTEVILMRVLLAVCALALSGCVSTTVTTPEGLTVERVAVWSDFTIKATRSADGSISVEETQTGDQAALLDLLRAGVGR